MCSDKTSNLGPDSMSWHIMGEQEQHSLAFSSKYEKNENRYKEICIIYAESDFDLTRWRKKTYFAGRWAAQTYGDTEAGRGEVLGKTSINFKRKSIIHLEC